MAIGIAVGGWRVVKKNGKIPYTPLEQLFWRRVGNLKKIIKKTASKGDTVACAMWTNKLYELSKNIDKRRYTHGR